MNTTFWIAASLLMVLVIGLLAWPLMRQRGRNEAASRQAINLAIYRDQMTELVADRDSGTLAEADYLRAREELERRVLEDTGGDAAAPATAPARMSRTALALLVLIPALAVPLYFVLGTPAALNPQAVEAAQAGHGEEMTPERLEKLAAGLAAKLAQNPDNPQGWAMLGRSYKVLGRLDEAEKAFARAGGIMDTEPTLMLEQVELAAFRHNGKIEGKALEILEKLLQKEPDNPMALLYAGSNAYFDQRYTQAAGYWERLLKQVDPASDDARNLTLGVARAKELAVSKGPAPLTLPWAGNAAEAAPPASQPANAPAAAGAGISGQVDLDKSLKAKAGPDDTVFIFARAVQGPRMPLAVVRARVSDLPMAFTLDDSTAMSPELRLSLAKEVRVEAKISKSGNAVPQSGDLTGSVGPLKPGARDVRLNIDHVVP